MYVRYTKRYLLCAWREPTLDLASIETVRKGRGYFTKLFYRLRDEYPELHLYVESVVNERFAKKLLKLGFQQVGESISPCFYMPPKSV
jgi:hypothetical protein